MDFAQEEEKADGTSLLKLFSEIEITGYANHTDKKKWTKEKHRIISIIKFARNI